MNEMTSIRKEELRQMLYGRRQEMQSDVQSRIQHVRTNRATEVLDELESSDAHILDDLELALIQMKAGTQVRIGEALVRLDAGEYGYCFDCRGEIAAKRLRALPFAVRCTACEDRHEQEAERSWRLEQRRGDHSLFAEVPGP